MPYKQRQNRTNYQQRTHHTRESTADVSILDQTFALHPQTGSLPRVNMDMNGISLKFLIDTGSSVNTIDEKSFNTLKPQPHLEPYPNQIVGYPSNPLNILGTFETTLSTSNNSCTASIVVVSGQAEHLLSFQTSVDLKLIQLIEPKISISSISSQDQNHTTPGWTMTLEDLKLKTGDKLYAQIKSTALLGDSL